jgi:DNA-binding MarR family transcriptional regulator
MTRKKQAATATRSLNADLLENLQTIKDKHPKEMWPGVAYVIRETSRMFSTALEDRLSKHDISLAQARYLGVLWLEDGLTQGELTEVLGNSVPTTVIAINRLEKRGLITRRSSKTDKRKSHIFLSKKGRALESKVISEGLKVERIAMKHLSKTEVKALSNMIGRIQAELRPLQ